MREMVELRGGPKDGERHEVLARTYRTLFPQASGKISVDYTPLVEDGNAVLTDDGLPVYACERIAPEDQQYIDEVMEERRRRQAGPAH